MIHLLESLFTVIGAFALGIGIVLLKVVYELMVLKDMVEKVLMENLKDKKEEKL